ncbi:hypothetical protein Tco_1514432 [Tanacetum coccineum]
MDEAFIATAYPEVQENLKLTADKPMITKGTCQHYRDVVFSFNHLTRTSAYGDQFIDDKPSEANNEKTHQALRLNQWCRSNRASPNVHWPLPTTTTTTSAITTTLPLPPQPQQGSSDPIIIKRMGELEEFIATLVEENQALETRLDKQGSRINKVGN